MPSERSYKALLESSEAVIDAAISAVAVAEARGLLNDSDMQHASEMVTMMRAARLKMDRAVVPKVHRDRK